jgi:hypothetical protein
MQSMVLHLWGQMPGDWLQPASLPLEHGTNRPVTVLLIACAGITKADNQTRTGLRLPPAPLGAGGGGMHRTQSEKRKKKKEKDSQISLSFFLSVFPSLAVSSMLDLTHDTNC